MHSKPYHIWAKNKNFEISMLAVVYFPHLTLKTTLVPIFMIKMKISRLHQHQGILLPFTKAFASKCCCFIILA